ncbi:hypothetical protein [Acinetobacter baumannii]
MYKEVFWYWYPHWWGNWGIAAYQLVDAFDKELEAFTAWTVF